MINNMTIISATSGKEYKIYTYNGEIKGCSCLYHQYHPTAVCKHMKQAIQQRKDAERTAYNNYCLSLGI